MNLPKDRTTAIPSTRQPLPARRSRRRAAMLLEIILAVGALLFGMAVIGIQIKTAVEAAYDNEHQTQATYLAEAKLAQLDSGVLFLETGRRIEQEVEGDFGKTFPGYFWRFTFLPHEELIDMFHVQLDILYGQPESDLEPGDIEDAAVVKTLYTMRPTPPTLNLQRDFGVTDERLAEISETLPPEILDPTEISPLMFAEMDLETLLELMPTLMEIFGAGFGFSESQIQQAIDMGLLENLPTGGGNPLDEAGGGGGQSGGFNDQGFEDAFRANPGAGTRSGPQTPGGRGRGR